MSKQREWPADKVERRKVADLIPYARNARTHSPEQVDQIAASIKEWGWTTAVLVDETGQIIAGHGRILAAQKLKLTEIPVMIAKGWTEAQKRAYVLADNKIALNAGWDMDLLKVELLDLDHENFDLGLIGFHEDELANIFAPTFDDEDVARAEETPEPPVNPVTVLGDVWILGNHRIVCGDSTKADDVAKALNGVKPHLMVTDPPYGVEYDANWRNEAMPQKNDPTRWKDGSGRATGAVMNDDKADWSEAWALFPGDVAYVWHAGNMAHTVAESIIKCGLNIRAQIIWAKSQFVISRGDYHPHHEPCWYAVRKGKTGHYKGDRKQSTLWQIDKPQKSETGHSTQKPIECMKRPIENNSSPGQAVYEPFSGSGTTIMAGELTGRHIHAIELSPAYVDVAIKRWQDFTGKKAILEATGQTIDEVSTARYESGEWAKNTSGSYDVGIKEMKKKRHEDKTEKTRKSA
jgi:DNA modification methylase